MCVYRRIVGRYLCGCYIHSKMRIDRSVAIARSHHNTVTVIIEWRHNDVNRVPIISYPKLLIRDIIDFVHIWMYSSNTQLEFERIRHTFQNDVRRRKSLSRIPQRPNDLWWLQRRWIDQTANVHLSTHYLHRPQRISVVPLFVAIMSINIGINGFGRIGRYV